jgi:hypothetical protein
MTTIRPQNIIIFSAGKSKENGNLSTVKSFFTKQGYNCYAWDEIAIANDPDKKVLLTLLIKKIPTFDFAIILGDGVDELEKFRDVKITTEVGKHIMRDNVVFECGLCIMALGTDRVILLIEENVRIFDDLFIIPDVVYNVNGTTGIETIKYHNNPTPQEMKIVVKHIEKVKTDLSPIVIGAAVSTADGYFSNFILRFWENIGNGFADLNTKKEFTNLNISQIQMNICIPAKIDENVKKNIFNYYDTNEYKRGITLDRKNGEKSDGTFRGVEFRYKQIEDKLIICDIPSTLTASFSTVKDILNLRADESHDNEAEKRFLSKERDTFLYTLDILMKEKVITSKLKTFPSYTDEKIRNILKVMKQVNIETINL